jgi:hypothetical protein
LKNDGRNKPEAGFADTKTISHRMSEEKKIDKK